MNLQRFVVEAGAVALAAVVADAVGVVGDIVVDVAVAVVVAVAVGIVDVVLVIVVDLNGNKTA